MSKTSLSDGIRYKTEVIRQICASQPIIGLLGNDPDIDLGSEEASFLMDTTIYDFNYISKTVERADAFIMVDSDMISPTSGTMNAWELYVQIVCHKEYVSLDPSIFKRVVGNRLDNLTCEVDQVLNGTRLFGIGQLELSSCTTAVVPDSFSSKMLTYRINEFRRERSGL